MIEEKSLKIVNKTFITKDRKKLEREQLSDEQYQIFCNQFEYSRIKYKVKWVEMDERYMKEE